MGLAVGPRQAGLAHRVLGDGGEDARAGVLDPRRRARPRLPTPRERAGAVAGRRAALRQDLDAQRPAPLRRREDVEIGRQRRHDPGRDRRVGAGGGAALPDDGPLAQAARVLARGDDRRGASRSRASATRCAARSARRGDWDALRRGRSTTTSTHPPRSPCSTAGRARARSTSCSEGWRSSGSARSATASRRPGELVALARARTEARAARDFAESDRLRDEIAAAGWEVRDVPGRLRARAARRDARARLRPERRARGAARPPRGARALGLRARRRLARLARRRARDRRSSRSAS